MPSLVQDGTISNAEFLQRLSYALDNYKEYCRIMGVSKQSAPPIEWLDHFIEFLTLDELEKKRLK